MDSNYNGMRLRVAGIIDIKGEYIKVQGTIQGREEETYVGTPASRMAYMAYDKYQTKTWEAEAFAYWNGWYHLYSESNRSN